MNDFVLTPSEKLYESKALREVTGPAIRPGGLVLTERALGFCALATGSPVLDVGCGSGATAAHLRSAHDLDAVGLDLSRKLLSEGKTLPGQPLLTEGRAELLPFRDRWFSALFCECVLSLLETPERALPEWHRVLAPGGYLVLSDLYDRSGNFGDGLLAALERCCLDGVYGQQDLCRRIERAGFDLLLFEDHTPLLKQLAARLVWTHGSLDAFWSAAKMGCATARPGVGKPGYYLLIACKGARQDG